jgi:hypothetical protein
MYLLGCHGTCLIAFTSITLPHAGSGVRRGAVVPLQIQLPVMSASLPVMTAI